MLTHAGGTGAAHVYERHIIMSPLPVAATLPLPLRLSSAAASGRVALALAAILAATGATPRYYYLVVVGPRFQ